ncbi:MAG TPA: PIG-L family deacetylase [Candidatus Limnocylindrales bacterium]|nr:PIG-L family deacetylase [Candidatus Limnocylindrales bacterium]
MKATVNVAGTRDARTRAPSGRSHRAIGATCMLAAMLLAAPPVQAQEPLMHAGMLAHALDRLTVTGRVLYVAAHPDDENTRLLTYLSNGRHWTAAYLSMTRGGGGQNLIGTEQDALLDVLRTEELLAARRLDGAQQRFTRMRDFGFSKSAQETLSIWGHEEALSDVVWVIRTFQPDVVIARFNELPPNHGHHTASAILAREAVEAAADADRFTDQLGRGASVWKVHRLVLNVPSWSEAPPPPADAIVLDVGQYDARLGLGYSDLAARSRSLHKSQGFGTAGERGAVLERFVPVSGAPLAGDILEGIDASWMRYGAAAAPLVEALSAAGRALDRDAPEKAVPALLSARTALAALPQHDVRVRDARAALEAVVAAATGLYVRATAERPEAVPGSSVKIKLEVTARREHPMRLRRVSFPGAEPVADDSALAVNQKKEISVVVAVPADAPISAPYWLAAPSRSGHQVVEDLRLVGEPSGPPPLSVGVDLDVGGHEMHVDVPVVFAWVDGVQGERVRSFLVVPPATVTPSRQAVMLRSGAPAPVSLRIRAGRDELSGEVGLELPAGWTAQPPVVPVTLAKAGDETTVQLLLTPPAGAAGGVRIRPYYQEHGRRWSHRRDVIDYAHVPMQVVLQPAEIAAVPLELELPGGRIGFIEGPGDTVAEDLGHVGAAVELLDDAAISGGDLSQYSAILVGIRAYNTRAVLRSAHERLMRYVEQGGTVVVQYNTNSRLAPLSTPIGPYPLTIGRERVTDETAPMTPLDREMAVLHSPNVITEADFEGWVQERGLYFAESWDDRYLPVFESGDPGEKPLRGGVLITTHGRGRYVYTGLSFFRQLPAGVPGAYRLLANLLSRPQP